MNRKSTFISIAAAALAAVALGAAPSQAAADQADAKGRQAAATARPVAADVNASKAPAASQPVSAAVAQASATIQSRIVDYVRGNGTRHDFGTYADPATGKVVIETNAPSTVVSSVVGTLGRMVQVRSTSISDSFSRRDDVAPYWGGAGITLTAPNPRCSSGYAVRNSAGTRFMVTAGHCFSNGQTARTELGGRVVGVVSGNGLPSADMELIGGQSYGSSIYIGGVNSSTGAHVASAADPVVGFNNYCHSGRTTGENCGHTVTSVSATVCTTSGCKSPVIAFTGGVLPQGGDSGSPFYANSVSAPDKHIRGHIIAIGGGTAYAEKWSRVSARYGVSIVS
jgi:hypothetical protein